MNRPSTARCSRSSTAPRSIGFDFEEASGHRWLGGLGQAIAEEARVRGAAVTVVGRTLRQDPGPRLNFIEADLSLMARAKRLGQDLPVEDSDVALFTSGIFAASPREGTAEGIERDMAVSFLNRMAILGGLHHLLGVARPASSFPPRVFVMGSPGMTLGNPNDLNSEAAYKAMTAHRNTVAGNEALALAGSRMFPETRVLRSRSRDDQDRHSRKLDGPQRKSGVPAT
jgi:NAD(P)-dependent dehydrogenase (short-subunit alcohol dehydrogenase family)